MSVPFGDPATWVPTAVLIASLLGSAHCVSMCGGLVVATAKTPRTWLLYHLGRLLGYLSLGTFAGFLGGTVLGIRIEDRWVSLGAALILGFGFIAAGIRVWQGKVPHLSIVPQSVLKKAYKHTTGKIFATGLLTVLLPCGWLHAFVLGAVATQSPLRGAGFLMMFWLGTLPALAATPWLTRSILRPISIRAPRVAATLLIVAGVVSVGSKVWPEFYQDRAEQVEHCGH